ncbi:hypothetical protein ID866_6215 [Astraeus odoratus]|nr:hypothetical protein ID866_6215 [Astraeus odoratus]
MSRQLATEFREKGREFGTLNRVYCAQQTCSRFLGPLTEGPFGPATYDCPAPGCTTRTCARCRGRYDGWLHICRQDQGAEHVLNMGRTEGWARCPGCSQMIELNMGCYHMTCRCRTEFCYMCRARWKTCRCPQWDERRLLAVAEHRVDAQFGAPRRAQPAQQQQQLARPVAAVQPVAPRPAPVPLPRVAPAPPVPPRPQPAPVAPQRPLSAAQVHRLFQGQTQTPQAPVVQPRATQMNNGLEVHTPAVRTGAPVAGPSTSAARTSQLFGQTETTTRRNSWYEQMVASRETTPRVRMPPPIPPKPAGITNPSRAGIPSASVSKLTATTTQAQTTTQFPAQPATRTTPGIPRTLPVKPNKSQRRRAEDDTRGSGSGSGSGVGTQHDAVRQRMIREMMDRLRVDHDCDHIKWTYRRGGGRCENCYHELPLYLFVSVLFVGLA